MFVTVEYVLKEDKNASYKIDQNVYKSIRNDNNTSSDLPVKPQYSRRVSPRMGTFTLYVTFL